MTITRAAFLALVFLATPPATEAAPAKVTRLIAQWHYSINICRGSPKAQWFAPDTLAACDAEQRYERRLNWLGWCYGRKSDPYNAAYNWHRCKADSFRANPEVTQ